MRLTPEVYVNEYEPWVGVLVSDATLDEARAAAEAEIGQSIAYLGIRVEPILHDNGRPGRRRRFYVFTDEPSTGSEEGGPTRVE